MSQSSDNPIEFMEAYKLHLIDLYAIRSSVDLGFMCDYDLSHPICHDVTWILERLLGDEFVEQPLYTDDSNKIEELLLSCLCRGMLVIIQQNILGGLDKKTDDKDRTHWLALIGLGSMSILAESTLQDCSTINLYDTVELVDRIVNIFNGVEPSDDTYDGTKYQHDMRFMIFTRFPVNAKIIHSYIDNNKHKHFNVRSSSFKHGHKDVPYWSIRDELLQSYN